MLDSTDPQAVIDAIKARRTWRNMPIRAGAGYIDGRYAWPSSAFTQLRSLGVTAVEITVTGQPSADAAGRHPAGDDEPGDMTPAETAEWAAKEHAAGRVPSLYVNRDNKPETARECAARGLIPGREFVWWVATLDGSFTDTGGADLRTEKGVVAIQFATAEMLGIHADASVITTTGNAWFHTEPTWEEEALDLSTRLSRLLGAHQ